MQYSAYSMDPIIQVKPDENGAYDFSGIYSNEYVDLWRRREKVAKGALHGELEEQYDLWYQEIQAGWTGERQDNIDNDNKDN